MKNKMKSLAGKWLTGKWLTGKWLAGAAMLMSAWLAAPVAAAQDGKEFLYIENTNSGDVTIMSIPEHEVTGTIPASVIGHHPDDLVLSPDGRTLYVNRMDTEDVVAVDVRTGKALFTVKLSGMPHHMTLSADGRYLYVPIFNYPRLDVVDVKTRKVAAQIKVGWGAHGTRLSPDGKRLYVGHIFSNSISVIDVATNTVIKDIPFEDGVRPFEISPDEKKIYVQLSRLHGFKVADIDSGKVVQTVNMPSTLPAGVTVPFPFTVDHGLALTRDGKTLFAVGAVTGNLVIYDLPEMRVRAEIPLGREPNWVILNQDESFAYVSNRLDDTISVISIAEMKEIKRVTVGDFPQRMRTGFITK